MPVPGVLHTVLAELRAEGGTLAVFLTGSHARGEADAFSDLDVSVLVSAEEHVGGGATYRDGVLVAIERSTVAHRERALSDPVTALWNLTSLRTGRALHDPHGVFADLQARARAFEWSSLADAAHLQAAQRLSGSAEEVHKLMGGLAAGNAGKVLFALSGLAYALGDAALLGTGTLIETENRYLTLARDAWGDPEWRAAFATAAGLTGEDAGARGRAGLGAYVRAVALTRWAPESGEPEAREAARRAAAFLHGGAGPWPPALP